MDVILPFSLEIISDKTKLQTTDNTVITARQRLRSSSSSTLVVPPTRLSTAGDRAFPVAAARTWNSLSRSLTSVTSLASFRRQLKTELFVRSFPDLDSSA